MEIVYLYIESFQWVNPMDADSVDGHPKPKSVYRTTYDAATGNYRIIYKLDGSDVRAIVINKLINDEIDLGFACKIVELNKTSLLKYDLIESELDKLVKWFDTDNTDLKKVLSEPLQPEHKKNDLIRVDTASMEFFECALKLRDFNPLLFDSLHEFIHHVLDEDIPETSIDATWITLSKKFGTGANISKVLEYLSIYAGDDRKTNLDEKDLFDAIKYLLNEHTQRQLNG